MDLPALKEFLDKDHETEYELYLNIHVLFDAQKSLTSLSCNDELTFQVSHQSIELLMKIINVSLSELTECLIDEHRSGRALVLLDRIVSSSKNMITMLDPLETISPKYYQSIRLVVGNGSGRTSPGFRGILAQSQEVWSAYLEGHLGGDVAQLRNVYSVAEPSVSYFIAEKLLEFDNLFNRWLYNHIRLIDRIIGNSAKTLRGKTLDDLHERLSMRLFPDLWAIRNELTDEWTEQHGTIPSLKEVPR